MRSLVKKYSMRMAEKRENDEHDHHDAPIIIARRRIDSAARAFHEQQGLQQERDENTRADTDRRHAEALEKVASRPLCLELRVDSPTRELCAV